MARGVWRRRIRRALAAHRVDPAHGDTYQPEVAFAFAHLAELDPELFAARMREIGPPFVVRALATDHIAWARKIRIKHRLVNWAFLLTGAALGFFLGVGVSYLIRLTVAG